MATKIQVDMFEVQLGAALLLQFRTDDGDLVRVLADAGVDTHGSGYKPEHVLNKLFNKDGSPTDVWQGAEPHLNLIVGTHYDGDHLVGLVPVIENEALGIDEVWLPPVQDDGDTIDHASVSGGESSLALRLFAADEPRQFLNDYLDRRVARIGQIEAAYQAVRAMPFMAERDDLREELPTEVGANGYDAFFAGQLLAAAGRLGQSVDEHQHDAGIESDERFLRAAKRVRAFAAQPVTLVLADGKVVLPGITARNLPGIGRADPQVFDADVRALESLRKSTAAEAITASHLAKVVAAVRQRNSNGARIRIRAETIPEGRPRYFRWRKDRFQEAGRPGPAELGFHLMGPSQELVASLHEKLPIGTYLLAYRAESLNSGSVTPSNRLSYVMRFAMEGQALLVSGDAGFTDFAPPRSKAFHPDLLKLLQPLHVVQVAHHGGMNHRFYEALQAGGLPMQKDWSFLLLSHKTDDPSRPRVEFSRFVALFRDDARNDVSVLFTSRPQRAKVDDFIDLVHPVAPASAEDDVGDVRLTYPNPPDGDRANTRWRVQRHAVKP